MRSKKVRTTDCSSVGRANFPSLLDNPAHPFSSSSPLSFSLSLSSSTTGFNRHFSVSLTRQENKPTISSNRSLRSLTFHFITSSRPFFPTQTKTSFFKKKKKRMGESSTRLLSPSSMLRPRERKRERTIASTWDNSRDKFQGKDKIPNFRFRRDKRELKYINKRKGRVVFPTERTKLPREILSFSSRIVRSIPSSR